MSDTGRRSASRRGGLNPTAVLALVLPALTVGALFLVRPADLSAEPRPPDSTTLTSSVAGCPSALGRASSVSVTTGQQSASGEVRLTGEKEQQVRVRPQRVTRVSGVPGHAVAAANGRLAPGLLAARFGDGPAAATACPTPVPETWFTGVGAAAEHASVLELVNPDAGAAIADITVYGAKGVLEEPSLRGVTISGGQSKRIDLSEATPRRGELTLQVVVSRGRLAASLLDEFRPIGSGQPSSEWLPGQPEPQRSQLMLGLAPGKGDDTLLVTNPGEDEARVDVEVVTKDASFAPQGLEELRVLPGAVAELPLTTAVRNQISDGALGLQVESSAPVAASVRSTIDGDLSFAAPVASSDIPMSALVPEGDASVVLADADAVGVATVTAWSEAGKELVTKRVELERGTGGKVDLPRGAALVRVEPQRTGVHAAVLVAGDGATVVPMRAAVTKALIPDLRPGLP